MGAGEVGRGVSGEGAAIAALCANQLPYVLGLSTLVNLAGQP